LYNFFIFFFFFSSRRRHTRLQGDWSSDVCSSDLLLQLSSSKETTRMQKHLLNRRQFSARCAAFGLSFPALSAMIAAQATAQVPGAGAASKPAARTVRLPDGTTVPALGQGCWHLGQGRHPLAVEEEALRTGISLGMTLID